VSEIDAVTAGSTGTGRTFSFIALQNAPSKMRRRFAAGLLEETREIGRVLKAKKVRDLRDA
jgi:hypothetical protein